MGWSIALIENTVEVPSGLAEDLVTADKYQEVFYDVDDNIHDNRNGKNSDEKFKDTGDFYKIAIEYPKDGNDNYTANTVAKTMLLRP